MQTVNTVIIYILLAISSVGGSNLWYPGKVPTDTAQNNSVESSKPLEPRSACIPVEYVKNYDGDTMTVNILGISLLEDRGRFIGVDTDEKGQTQRAKKATEFTRQRLQNSEIYLEFDTRLRDKYDRLLAYVWLEDSTGRRSMLNRQLLAKDLAELMIIPPDDEFEKFLRKYIPN